LNLLHRLFVLSVILLLNACAHFSGNTPSSPPLEVAPVEEEEAEELGNFSLEQDTLYDLLVAEVAAQRNEFSVTLVNYIHQAQITRDPAVIIRAINAAQLAKDTTATKELAYLWLDTEPDSIAAHQILAYQFSVEKNFKEAIYHIDRVIELDGDTRIEALAVSAQTLPEAQQLELLELYSQLNDKHPEKWEVRYSLAIVQRVRKMCEAAITNLDIVIEQQPDFPQAYVVKANCLNEGADKELGFEFIEASYERFPDSYALGRLYASLLIERNDLDTAEEVFAQLLEYYPKSASLLLSHALVMLENGKTEEAKAGFEALLDSKEHRNDASYYLGRIADQAGDKEQAIKRYQEVNGGLHYEVALERSSFLLIELDRKQEATDRLDALRKNNPKFAVQLWFTQYKLALAVNDEALAQTTLDDAIVAYPENEQLLYARAMHFDGKSDLPSMEKDLKTILAINPSNAIAMNALGYTLADKTDRLEEAIQLISAALSLKPENPAIMDSMGWVLFRLGKSQEALLFLAKAYEKYPDGEVAAHLGEVLLSVDQKEQAYALWKVALQRQPDHKILLATLARLAPELLNTTGEQGSEKTDENAPTTDLLKANERTPLELQTPANTGNSDDSLTQEAPATQG